MARGCRPISRRWSGWRSAIPPTTKRRCSTPSRSTSRASPSDKTYANQLKGAAILEPIFKRQPRHPGVAHYLIHLYDYSGPCGERHRCRQALCRDRAGRAARAAHALAHLHARRLLERIDRLEHRLGARGQGRQGVRRPAARHGLHGLCLSAARAGRQSARRRRRDERGHRRQSRRARPALMRWRPQPARYMVERGDWKGAAELQVRPTQVRLCPGDDAFRARAGRGPLRQSGRRQGRHRQARRAARQAARGQGRLLGGAGRHPAAGRDRMAARCRGQA